MKKRLSVALLSLLLVLSVLFSAGCLDALPDLPGFDPDINEQIPGGEETPGGGDETPGGGEENPGGGDETPGGGDDAPSGPVTLRNPGATPKLVDPAEHPAYSGEPYIAIDGNMPYFTAEEMVTTSFEYYSPLDSLGRCGYTVACIGPDIMPTEERGNIGMVKPSGWHTVKYDIVSGKYLYNRCHLIGYQLTGENVNESNLITGTRYLNIDGMVDFENMVADYIRETGNHVLYRVTPIFVGNELLARGVQMEAYSVEDQGDGICFHIYAYNVQPGITIDYATGLSALAGEPLPPAGEGSGTDIPPEEGAIDPGEVHDYVLNTNTKKFHYPDCSSAKDMSEANREDFTGTREAVTNRGYEACGRCKP